MITLARLCGLSGEQTNNNREKRKMKIELKNFKHAAFASHETNCYEATVYVDGKKAFYASNEGHGGADFYEPLHAEGKDPKQARLEFDAVMAKVEAHCATLPKWGSQYGGEDNMDVDLEILIGNLINKKLRERDLKKLMKAKVVMLDDNDAGELSIFEVKYKGVRAIKKHHIAATTSRYPSAIILNSLAFEEALEIYEEQA